MSDAARIKIISPLEKLYDEDSFPLKSYDYFSMLKNERQSFQIAIEGKAGAECCVNIESTVSGIRLYEVKHIKSDLPMSDKDADDYYRFSKSGYYPDLLVPVDGDSVTLGEGVTVLWAEVDGAQNDVGTHLITVSVGELKAEVKAEIIGAELDFSDFLYTNWYHTDCLMSYYGFDAFSDEYWSVCENFLKTAREHGMNCVLTPLFTPALDTEIGKERPTVQLVDVKVTKGVYSFNFDKLTRWIEMAHRCGVYHFECSHFYTQWGARHAPKIMAEVDGEYKKIFGWETKANSKEYREFLKAFSIHFKNYVEKKSLKDNIILHVSDEPNIGCLYNYSRASKYIHSLFKGYKIIDALSDYWFYKLKVVSNPVPANDHIDKFLGNVNNLWVYYCSGQRNHYVSNRFFCNESLRTRIIGYQMYKFDIKGFLQWGYNFYYTSLSKAFADPFEVSDAGKSFPSGDSYVVYPAKDGTPYHSIRLKVFYDALQDMAALKTLEKLTDKKTCLDVIEQNGKYSITFRNYPHDEGWMLSTRQKINELIKENSKGE